jgi:hypothetical protein
MADYALVRTRVPISVACIGLLYSKDDAVIGQGRSGENLINLIDLALLPLTPIMVSSIIRTRLIFVPIHFLFSLNRAMGVLRYSH